MEYIPIEFNNAYYLQWEALRNDWAEAKAREYILDYKYNGMKSIYYTTNQTKPVETYVLMKIYHILQGSGIDMSVRSILIQRNKTKVILDFYRLPIDRLNPT